MLSQSDADALTTDDRNGQMNEWKSNGATRNITINGVNSMLDDFIVNEGREHRTAVNK